MRSRWQRLVVGLGMVTVLIAALAACDPITINQRALFTSQSSVTITGSVLSRSSDPLVSVTVNGAVATLTATSSGWNYSAAVTVGGGPTFVTVVATARFQSGFSEIQRSTVAWANGTTVTLIPSGSAVSGGLATTLGSTAIAKLGPLLVPALSLPSSDFVIPNEDLGPGGGTDVQVESGTTVTVPSPTVVTNVSSGQLSVTATYTPTQLAVPVEAHLLGVPVSCTLNVSLSLTGLSTYTVSNDSGGNLTVAPGASLSATTAGAIASGCSSLSSTGLISSLVTAVTSSVQNDLAVELGPSLMPALQTELAGLSPSGAIGGAASGVSLAAPITSTALSGIGLSVTDSVTYNATAVASGATAQADSLAFGPAAATAPPGSSDWACAMTTATLNQLLSADTERGLLDRTISTVGGQPLTYNLLNTLVGLGAPITPDRPVQATVTAETSPAITDATPNGTHVGVVDVHGVRVTLTFADSTGGTILDTDMDVTGQADLGVADSAITLYGSGLTPTRVDVLTNPHALTAAQINGLATTMLPDTLAPLVTGVAVAQAPVIPGLGLSVLGTSRTGSTLELAGSYS
jgi:hypothetical protein